MPQTTDIVLNAAGYMIDPGTPTSPGYKRLQDGHPEGRTQRSSITDFFGGGNRALQLERDTFGASLAVGPALNGQGIVPWGAQWQPTIDAMTAELPNRDVRIPHLIVRDRLYVAIGKTLYRGPVTTPDFGFAWNVAKTYPNPITDLTIYNSYGILVSFGNAADIVFWNTNTNTDTTFIATERAHFLEAYGGYAIWSDARTASIPTVIRMAKGTGIDWRNLDHDPIAMTTVGAELMIATKQSLYTFTGRVKDVLVPNPNYPTQPNPQIPGKEWSGEFTPFFQQGVYAELDDFRLLLGYGGRTIAWIAGGVHEQVPSGDRAGWRSTGLSGRRCFGGCVAAGYLLVSIESFAGKNEIWAYDGNGWYRLAVQTIGTDGAGTWCSPAPLGSGGVYRTVMFFTHGSKNVLVFRLQEQLHQPGNGYMPHFPETAQFVTPLIDASERDKPKAWRKLGAVFASTRINGDPASVAGVPVALDYSIDAGITWVQVATSTRVGNNIAAMNFSLEAALQGVVSPFILLRVRWWDLYAWAPILVGVWVEHEVLQSPARRRKWQLRIHARDQEIDRDGVVFAKTGRELIEDLWAAWETDTPMTFRDIDYDTDPVQRTVRIVGITEHTSQPADANLWGDATITLNLVEV